MERSTARSAGLIATVSVCVACLTACDGRPPLRSAAKLEGGLQGRVVKGAVSSGVVTAYRVNSRLERLGAVKDATATTGEDGSFSLPITGYHGALLLVATGGTFTEEAVGTTVKLDGSELLYLFLGYQPEDRVQNILISPVSHLAYGLATHYVRAEGVAIQPASEEAWRHLNSHFGDLDWRFGSPTDPSLVEGAHLDADGKRGLVLAGLSMQARSIAETNDLTPGGRLNSLTLLKALYDDLSSDGFFDGISTAGKLFLPQSGGPHPQRLDGQTVRLSLALGVQRFLKSDRNVSAITPADSLQLRESIASNSNGRIFRENGAGYDDASPLVSIAGDGPPRYTREATVTFSILADDAGGTGVGNVFAANGDAAPLAGLLSDGKWTFTVPLAYGRNSVHVWAEDNAAPPNVGRARPAPASIVVEVTRDDSRPSPSPVLTPSFFDERALELEHSNGIVIVPPVHRFATGATKVVVRDLTEVFKADTRLSWGPQKPTGDELEGPNPYNVPFVQYEVPFNPDSDAPVIKATYEIEVSCAACPPISPQTGELIGSPHTEDQRRYFDLPLAVEAIPALAELQSSPATLLLRVTAEDAAGNSGTSTAILRVPFHVIGAPLSWMEEVGYRNANDPQSIHPYKLASGTYHDLWRSHVELGSAPRLVKYTVRNPYPVPVALRRDSLQGVSWTSTESWYWVTWARKTPFSQDGHQFENEYTWKIGGGYGGPTAGHPCRDVGPALPDGQFYFAMHYAGSTTRMDCPRSENGGYYPNLYPNTWGAPPDVVASSGVTTLAFLSPLSSGDEREQTQLIKDAAGAEYFVVPPAVGTTAGALAIYLTRPFVGRGYAWIGAGDGAYPAAGYGQVVHDYWKMRPKPGSVLQTGETFSCDCAWFSCDTCGRFDAMRTQKKLWSAREAVSGTLFLRTSPIRIDGLALGAIREFGSVSVSSTFSH